MQYKRLPSNLVEIDFGTPFPAKDLATLQARYFPNRALRVYFGFWWGLVCSIDEWGRYLDETLAGLQAERPDLVNLMLGEITEFEIWKAAHRCGGIFVMESECVA